MHPEISIVIPMYNAEKYIKETLLSILNQGDFNYELIIVDDGSKDSSVLECRSIHDSRVRIICQENQGAPAARNTGLYDSKGDYVVFFDADDIMEPDALNCMDQMIKETKSNADIICGNFYRWTDGKKQIEYKKLNYSESLYNRYMFSPYPCPKLFRRKFLLDNHLFFDKLRLSQDLNFYLKAIGVTDNVAFTSTPLASYRYVAGSISHVTDDRILDIDKNLKFVERYYDEKHVENDKRTLMYLTGLKHINYQFKKLCYLDDLNSISRYCHSFKLMWKYYSDKCAKFASIKVFVKYCIVSAVHFVVWTRVKRHMLKIK